MVKLFYVYGRKTGRDHGRRSLRVLCGWAALILILASPVSAQLLLEQQLSAYTGKNGSAYVAPLVDAFNADLNAGLYHSAYIPRAGLRLSLEIRFMSVFFTDEDRTFLATTERDFRPVQTVEVPTVVGPNGAVYVEGEGNTRYAFPGGFDLDSFSFAVPQLRIGAVYGSEVLVRYFAFNPGNVGFGALNLYGFGLQHSISQHIGARIPVDLAAGLFWQRFSMGRNERGDDLVTAEAFTAGIQVSKRIGEVEPYTNIAYDAFSMNVEYVARLINFTDETFYYDDVEFSFSSSKSYHVTVGVAFHFAFLTAHGEYNIGGQNALSFGLALQYHP